MPAAAWKGGSGEAGPLYSFSAHLSPQQLPCGAPRTFRSHRRYPPPQSPLLPRGFRPSRLFSYVKGVSGSQFSHNFTQELQLLTRGASTPTPFPPPPRGASGFPSPSLTGKPPESTFLDCGRQTPRSPRDADPVDFGWIGGGGTEGGLGGGRFCCQTPYPHHSPKTRASRQSKLPG